MSKIFHFLRDLWFVVQYRIFAIYKILISTFILKTYPPMALEQKLSELIITQVDFIDDSLEAKVEEVLTSFGAAHRIGLQIDQQAENDQTVEGVASGVLDLANEFGIAFKDLNGEQAARVKAAVRGIVTGDNEVLIENFFDACLDVIVKAKDLNNTVDDLNAPQEEV